MLIKLIENIPGDPRYKSGDTVEVGNSRACEWILREWAIVPEQEIQQAGEVPVVEIDVPKVKHGKKSVKK